MVPWIKVFSQGWGGDWAVVGGYIMYKRRLLGRWGGGGSGQFWINEINLLPPTPLLSTYTLWNLLKFENKDNEKKRDISFLI